MSESASDQSQPSGRTPAPPSTLTETGKQSNPVIAGFEILNKVGQGGMGAVFRARQISMDRIVALKILPKKLAADPACKERFLREARVSAKLNHVNLINGIECGESGGYTFFAMEFVEGQTAKDLLKQRGRMKIEEVVGIMRQISEALGYAHSRQLIHRDVKPENIMVSSNGAAKLCDLGLARSTEKSQDAGLTLAGQAVGTPYYISPEQARGQANLDARTDIYSLGATFYHLICGKPLFEANTSAAVMVKHLTEAAPSVMDLCPEVAAEYGMIIAKMLAKEPTDRYSDIAQLQRDLDAVASGKLPIAAEFRGKSSCLMPPKEWTVRPGTSSENPVTGRRTATGNTGLQGRTRNRTGPQKKNNTPLMAGAAVVLLGIVIFMATRGSTPPPAAITESAGTAITAKPAPKPAVTQAIRLAPVIVSKPVTPKNNPVEPAVVETAPLAPKSDPVIALLPNKAKPSTEDPDDPPTDAKVKPVEVAVVITPPDSPVVAANAATSQIDIAYAKFLNEVMKRAVKMDMSKVEKEARDLASKDDYKAAKDDIVAELADLLLTAKFEQDALAVLGKSKKTVDIAADQQMRKFGDKAKVEDYDPQRGLMVNVGGARMPLTSAALPLKTVLDSASTKTGYAPALLHLYRNARDEAQKLAASLTEKEKLSFDRKMNLIKLGDVELSARAAHAELTALVKAKQWKIYLEKLAVFEVIHRDSLMAQQKSGELAAFKEFADELLNPLVKIFGTKTAKFLPDGFIEVSYDFSSDQQLQAFTCEHAQLAIQDGGVYIPGAAEEYAQARFIAPIVEIRKLEATGKTLIRANRLAIYMIPTGSTEYESMPRVICRAGTRGANIENYETKVRGAKILDWSQGTVFSLDAKGTSWHWTVGGDDLGTVKLPDTAVGGNLAFVSVGGNHHWSNIKMVFKADPAWLAQKGVKGK